MYPLQGPRGGGGGGAQGGTLPHAMIFFETPQPIKTNALAPLGAPAT